ncbi:uncharacterized protein LOC133127368 [Conger conger]|uniref:uncharacterized protein LOC133127368 n=1 Tax=Conger conger TaxID=82655 RepID=UPI002A59EC36|nr:uncharacterized protein LOC133127368 [Conger conger]
MMKSWKVFLSVLYLLLYSSFSTAKLNPALVLKVDKGVDTSVKLLKSLNDLAKWIAKPGEGAETIKKVLHIIDGLAAFASALSFAGALVGFIFAFIPKQNPTLEFMKVQFSEVNRKLDSIALQIESLAKEMEWAAYASVYSRDENNIKNAWTKLREFIDSAAAAETEEEKTRFAERFTKFYETTGTESSVYNLHAYLTESNPASLNQNLLELVTEKSKGDFKTLVQFTSYFTSLMVTGLQLNLYYYALKGYDGKNKAEEAVTHLTNVRAKIQAVMIQCTDNFEAWAKGDVESIGTKPFQDNVHLAFSIKEHLDKKFNWYEWTIIVHDRKDEDRTFGNSITVIAQDKAVIHLLHREKGFHVNEGIKTEMTNEWNNKDTLCKAKKLNWPIIFKAKTMQHVEYIHEQPDFSQTLDNNLVQLKCPNILHNYQGHQWYGDYTTTTVYLRSQELVENSACFDVNCNNGKCRQIKDTSGGICQCEKMFYGPTCKGSVQEDIDYAVMEIKIIGISYQPVPDLTAIYYDLKEMKKYAEEVVKTLRQDIQWTQIFIKYIDVIEKFRYLEKSHSLLKNGTMSQDQFVSEVEALFTEGNTFLFMLHKFNLMMQGTGFGDTANILDILRQTLLTKSQSNPSIACSESYSERVDYFVRMMFAMETEAVLGWQKYRLELRNTKTPHVLGLDLRLDPFSSSSTTEDFQKKQDSDPMSIFKEYVSQQWSLFNKNGCGPLKAEQLFNAFCGKPYHSTDQQEVPLSCQNDYQPFPETMQCSKGKWNALPVCYIHPWRGATTCTSQEGATVCSASCFKGSTFSDGQTSKTYKCTKQPCPSFTPLSCNRCTMDSVCGGSEVCHNGKCVDGCSIFFCGVNAQCSTTYHVQSCSCVSPWIEWKKEQPQREGCRYQELQWVDGSAIGPLPENAVKSEKGFRVCRAQGPDGGWHGGWTINQIQYNICYYDYDWKQKAAASFQVLVDPCRGSGVYWLSGGIYVDSVDIGQAVQWPWITYMVCSLKSNGIPGKLFNTRSGLLCHYASGGKGDRDGNFYSLVKKRCV